MRLSDPPTAAELAQLRHRMAVFAGLQRGIGWLVALATVTAFVILLSSHGLLVALLAIPAGALLRLVLALLVMIPLAHVMLGRQAVRAMVQSSDR